MEFSFETFPLVLAHDVTLATDDPSADPSRYVIVYGNDMVPSAIQMGSSSTIRGFTLESFLDANLGNDGIVPSPDCAADTEATIDSVVVKRRLGVPLRHGIVAGGIGAVVAACDVTVTDTVVRDVADAGLFVALPSPASLVMVSTTTFDGNGVGIRVGGGRADLSSVTILHSRKMGLHVSSAAVDIAVAVQGGEIASNQQEGVRMVAVVPSSGQARLELTDTHVASNGANNASLDRRPGIEIATGQAVLRAVNVRDNQGGGLVVSGQGTAVNVEPFGGENALIVSNGFSGISPPGVTVRQGGTLTALSATIGANFGAGLVMEGDAGSVDLSNVVLDGNCVSSGDAAVNVLGGRLALRGGSVISNTRPAGGKHGLLQSGGSVVLEGSQTAPVTIRDNPGHGVEVRWIGAGVGFSASRAAFEGNGGNGLLIDNSSAGTGLPVAVGDCSITENGGIGIEILRSPPDAAGGTALKLSGNTLKGNRRGIQLGEPDSGAGVVVGDIVGNAILGSTAGGMWIFGHKGSSLTITGNEIVENEAEISPVGRAAGGLLYDGMPPETLVFRGNMIRDNGGNQVVVAVASSGGPALPVLDLSGGSCVAGEFNTFACYDHAPPNGTYVGLVAIGGVRVLASYDSWQSRMIGPAPPAPNIDYRVFDGAQVEITASCPACTLACP